MPEPIKIQPFGTVMLLPLRPTPQKTDAQKTEYPSLPFLKAHDLEVTVIEMLTTIPDYYVQPGFSEIPAIRHVKDVMKDWDLRTAKEYVEKIYKNNVDRIEAARVISQKSWNKEQMDNERI